VDWIKQVTNKQENKFLDLLVMGGTEVDYFWGLFVGQEEGTIPKILLLSRWVLSGIIPWSRRRHDSQNCSLVLLGYSDLSDTNHHNVST
jgi:hypothetical protein